jgi:hypothetical protein
MKFACDQRLERLGAFSPDDRRERTSAHALRRAQAKHFRPMSENLICG